MLASRKEKGEMRTLSTAIITAIFFIMGISAWQIAYAQLPGGYRGPCSPGYLENDEDQPPGCEEECTLWCSDPCIDLIYEAANCDNETGPCTRENTNQFDELCRYCSCDWFDGECIDEGLYYDGTEVVLDCSAN